MRKIIGEIASFFKPILTSATSNSLFSSRFLTLKRREPSLRFVIDKPPALLLHSNRVTMRYYTQLIPLLLAGLLAGCNSQNNTLPNTNNLVRTSHQKFTLNGAPYHFVGVNYWYAPLLGREEYPGDRARLIRELDELKERGHTNLRIIAISEISSATPLTPAAQPAPGIYDEAWFEGLDFAMAELAKRDMKAVLYVTNYWTWSGGIPQLVNWTTGKAVPDDDADWQERNAHVISFYQDKNAQQLYYQAVDHLLGRTNTINGRRYTSDPAIMAWQLCNEPRPGTWEQTAETAPHMLAWADKASTYFRDHGVRQLISLGSEGLYGVNSNEQLYRDLHALPNIDYLTVHLWPQNWAWFDPEKGDATIDKTLEETRKYLEHHIAIARDLDKPMVLEEFGLARDGGGFTPDSSVQHRNQFFRLIGDIFKNDLQQGGPFAGINIWTWSGEAIPSDSAGKYWSEGDVITGDNPIEPQGWYSIYSEDHESRQILSDLADFAENN